LAAAAVWRTLVPARETEVSTMTAKVESTKRAGATSDVPDEKPKALVSVAGMVRADELGIHNALIGGIAADKVAVERGMVRGAIAGHDLQLRQAGAGTILSAGSTSIRQGGAQTVISGGSVHIEQGGSGITLARRIELASGGTVVFAIAPSLEVQDGGRVIFGTRAALAIGALAAAAVASVVLAARGGRSRK
jgi:hypothetical protein